MTTIPTAADGKGLPTAKSFSQFIQLMEDGEFHADLSNALQTINAALNQHMIDHGGKPKGKLSIDINFRLEDGVFEITGGIDIKVPKTPRGKTIAWSTPDNQFTPQNPRQMQLFGVRDVSAGHDAKEVRSV
jgi:hypothetical protein